MTWAMMPVQCSINWAIKPTGSWSYCEFVIYPWRMNKWTADERSNRRNNCEDLSSIWSFIRSSKYMFHIFTFIEIGTVSLVLSVCYILGILYIIYYHWSFHRCHICRSSGRSPGQAQDCWQTATATSRGWIWWWRDWRWPSARMRKQRIFFQTTAITSTTLIICLNHLINSLCFKVKISERLELRLRQTAGMTTRPCLPYMCRSLFSVSQ